jgi:type VI protein secretion system component VasF
MDHKEQHHQHHEKEREEAKRHQKERERAEERKPRSIHPLWFLVLGCVLMALVLLLWIFIVP